MTDPAKAGPATICISQDVEGEAFDFDESFFEKRVHYIDRMQPSERELKGAAESEGEQPSRHFSGRRREVLRRA